MSKIQDYSAICIKRLKGKLTPTPRGFLRNRQSHGQKWKGQREAGIKVRLAPTPFSSWEWQCPWTDTQLPSPKFSDSSVPHLTWALYLHLDMVGEKAQLSQGGRLLSNYKGAHSSNFFCKNSVSTLFYVRETLCRWITKEIGRDYPGHEAAGMNNSINNFTHTNWWPWII